MELILKKVCGQPAQLHVTLRRCVPGEEQAIFALQNEVHALMPYPEQFVESTLAEITDCIKNDLCIGAWEEGRLGAYFTLRYCGEDEHNYAYFMGLPREQWKYWANADSTIVHPAWRGNGLQRLLLHAALDECRPEIIGLGATVSPANLYSLNNALAEGFEIVRRCDMYGGYDRYLLRKELAAK